MGQYYKPVSLTSKEYLYTHDFKSTFKGHDGKTITVGQGLKLMEHSYIDNQVMNAVESLLIPKGKWHKHRIVWAGDYADHEKGYKKSPQGYDVNIYSIMEKEGKKIKPSTKKIDKDFHFLLNHTKKVAIDLSKIKADKEGWKIHPLSLLVCEGNGRGGGDFHGKDNRIGTWARDIISIEKEVPSTFELEEFNDFVE